MNIVFFGTSNVALPILESLKRTHKILAVVTALDGKVGRSQELKESPVSVLAKEMEIPLLKPETVKGNSEFVKQLAGLKADIFVVVSYGKILPLEIINLPEHKTLNIHFSLLPKYRGASPIQFALLNGEKETGTTIFVLDEKMDTGPIIAQEKTIIDQDDNFITLSQKLAFQSAKLLVSVLPGYVQGTIKPLPQNNTEASVSKIIGKEDGKIIWQKSAQEIYNQFRAYYPWPGVWAKWGEKTVKFLDCGVNGFVPGNEAPGTVLSNGIVVCGKKTALEIRSLQLEGKNQIGILDFLNGYQDFVGSRLE